MHIAYQQLQPKFALKNNTVVLFSRNPPKVVHVLKTVGQKSILQISYMKKSTFTE